MLLALCVRTGTVLEGQPSWVLGGSKKMRMTYLKEDPVSYVVVLASTTVVVMTHSISHSSRGRAKQDRKDPMIVERSRWMTYFIKDPEYGWAKGTVWY